MSDIGLGNVEFSLKEGSVGSDSVAIFFTIVLLVGNL